MSTLSMDEFRALGEIAKARRTNLVRMFAGTTLTFGRVAKVESAAKVMKKGKSAGKAAKKAFDAAGGASIGTGLTAPGHVATGAADMAREFMKECAGVENIQEIVEATTEAAVSEMVAEIIPWFSIGVSAFKVAKTGREVYKTAKKLNKSAEWQKGCLPGDPLAAADAVRKLIERSLTQKSINLGRHTTALGTKIAAGLLDGGTVTTAAIGAGNALAGLCLELYALGVSIREMKAGNKRLKSPNTLDLTVFEDCPILGCYLLACSDTSSVANFFVADIGLPGWMDKVEQLKAKKLDKLIKVSRKAIDKSSIQLSGLAQDKGVHASPGFFAKVKSKAIKAIPA